MFEKLQIRDFRYNHKLDIPFDKITVLRGASGRGKSSAMGALKWVAFNRPSGTSLINWDGDTAKVRLLVDSHEIIRKRNLKHNYYKADGQKFKALRTGVPPTVSSMLNLEPLNFHRQHAGPFWFSETAGEVSRQLNKIVNLDIIDTTVKNLKSIQRKNSILKEDSKKRVKSYVQERKELAFVLKMNKNLVTVENKEKRLNKHTEKARRLRDLVDRAVRIRPKLKTASERATEVATAYEKGRLYEEIRGEVERLTELVAQGEGCKEKLAKKMPPIKLLERRGIKWKKMQDACARLESLINTAKSTQDKISKLTVKVKNLDLLFTKKMGDRCALCGNPVKRKKITP